MQFIRVCFIRRTINCIVKSTEGSKTGGRGGGGAAFKLHVLVFTVCKLTFSLLSTQRLYLAVNQLRPCQSVGSISCLLVKATVGTERQLVHTALGG